MKLRSLCLTFILLTGIAIQPGAAAAATWPEKPVHIIVGWSAGGATDVIARYLAQQLGEALGQQFIVENRPGAGGNIAAELVARAPADGNTLIFLTSAHAINATLYKSLPFDPVKSFTPLAVIGNMTQMLVIHPSLPYHSAEELINDVRKNPDKLKYASAGNGSSSHLAVEQLQAKADLELMHVPYKGTSQYLPDLIAGRVDMAIDSATALLPPVRNKQLRALAISSHARSDMLPDLPTIAESGVPDYGVNLWFGFLGPSGMPTDLTERINTEIRNIVARPAVIEQLKEFGLTVSSDYTAPEFRDLLNEDIEQYADIIKASGAQVE